MRPKLWTIWPQFYIMSKRNLEQLTIWKLTDYCKVHGMSSFMLHENLFDDASGPQTGPKFTLHHNKAIHSVGMWPGVTRRKHLLKTDEKCFPSAMILILRQIAKRKVTDDHTISLLKSSYSQNCQPNKPTLKTCDNLVIPLFPFERDRKTFCFCCK